MPHTDPDDDSEVADRPSDDTRADRLAAENNRYLRRATEQPEEAHREQARLIEELSAENSTGRNELERRPAASGALAKLARNYPATLETFVPELVEELRRETDSTLVTDTASVCSTYFLATSQ